MSADKRLRVVFMGTPAFAADILEEISQQLDIVCVYTQPDKVRGRGSKTVPSPVKLVAQKLSLPVRCASSFKDEEAIRALAELAPDVICVAAFGAILPKAVLDIPPLGCINVHASCLPRWRGAAPVERALLAGDEEVGICIMRMEEGLDTGDYCVCRKTAVGDQDASELTAQLAMLGAEALITALEHIRAGQVQWIPQDGERATYAKKLMKHELDLSPEMKAIDGRWCVQASSPAHPSKCIIGNRTVTVLKAAVPDGSAFDAPAQGEAIFAQGRLLLGFSDGPLELLALKPDGKREMTAQAFASGLPGLKEGIGWEAL